MGHYLKIQHLNKHCFSNWDKIITPLKIILSLIIFFFFWLITFQLFTMVFFRSILQSNNIYIYAKNFSFQFQCKALVLVLRCINFPNWENRHCFYVLRESWMQQSPEYGQRMLCQKQQRHVINLWIHLFSLVVLIKF